ncbi:hypothetical protein NHX12_000875 [Muraenolepis orangiensis]|uniref:Uncharacterized protein n=1 Tax=Muraenolepis orangiensis TaxID=630683 RepID=A0A9Q0E3G2_9TELE|nr:hypothetical protein NHX12_000875 [Muraenolepis orangiensis]
MELHLPSTPGLSPPRGRLSHYDVYLYKVPQLTPVHHGLRHRPRPLGPGLHNAGPPGGTGRVLRWEDDSYPPSPPCPVCSPLSALFPPSLEQPIFFNQRSPSRAAELWTP